MTHHNAGLNQKEGCRELSILSIKGKEKVSLRYRKISAVEKDFQHILFCFVSYKENIYSQAFVKY